MSDYRRRVMLERLLYAAVWAVGAWLLLTVALPWLLPFLLGLSLAWLLERPVVFLMERLRLPRWGAAAVCTGALGTGLCALLGLLAWRLGYEAAVLLGRLPVLLSGLPSLGSQLEKWAYRFLIAAPVGLQDFLRSAMESLVEQSISLPNRLYDVLEGAVTGAVRALPDALLFLLTTVLAAYFSSASRPALLAFLRRQLPRPWLPKVAAARRLMKGTLGCWLRAQGLLMLITFGELFLGLLLLRVDLAFLVAALAAAVDALPVLGSGTVLLPWAAFTLLTGDWTQALGLGVLYAVVTVVRSLLEPKLVGERLGLPPLAALLAMYVGFQAFGVAGMVLAPLGAVLLKALHDCGLVRLWRD